MAQVTGAVQGQDQIDPLNPEGFRKPSLKSLKQPRIGIQRIGQGLELGLRLTVQNLDDVRSGRDGLSEQSAGGTRDLWHQPQQGLWQLIRWHRHRRVLHPVERCTAGPIPQGQ